MSVKQKSVKQKEPVDMRLLKSAYQPDHNPLIETATIPVKKKIVRSGLASKTLVDIETGEVQASSVIHQIEEKDDQHFVKVFAAGISAAYDLTRTGQRVFQAILHEYESAPLRGGFVDSIYLAWFDGGLSGRDIGMSERTFNRGLRELLEKQFIAPKVPNVYWVNPALFFKGDRFLLIKEYRRKTKTQAEELEDKGQQRLVD